MTSSVWCEPVKFHCRARHPPSPIGEMASYLRGVGCVYEVCGMGVLGRFRGLHVSADPAGDNSGHPVRRPPCLHEQTAARLVAFYPPADVSTATDCHLAGTHDAFVPLKGFTNAVREGNGARGGTRTPAPSVLVSARRCLAVRSGWGFAETVCRAVLANPARLHIVREQTVSRDAGLRPIAAAHACGAAADRDHSGEQIATPALRRENFGRTFSPSPPGLRAWISVPP